MTQFVNVQLVIVVTFWNDPPMIVAYSNFILKLATPRIVKFCPRYNGVPGDPVAT